MGLGLLLIPALGGYWFLTRYHRTRDSLHRANGYHVVLRSAIAGLVLFLIARLTTTVVALYWPDVGQLWRRFFFSVDYSGTSTLSVVLGFGAPYLLNRFTNRNRAQRELAQHQGNLIELLIDEALDRKMFVEISLSNGKSYIGTPLMNGFPSREYADIAIIPAFSGYRDKETQELCISASYMPALSAIVGSRTDPGTLDAEDFRVIIPMREILTARLFDPEAYVQLNRDAD
ncbi:MAG: hypothetical protein OXH37_12530 [Gammaproteobacteria bacterium]|nr:hypothetical protein [Gammaproteobacteria bacterium]